MSDGSVIQWLQRPCTKPATLNPIRSRDRNTGKRGWYCEHVSEACRNCYAEALNVKPGMSGGTGLEYKPGWLYRNDIYLDEQTLIQPMKWSKPRTIFWCSMTDAFGRWVKDEMLDRIFAVCGLTPQHTHIFLTKRPERFKPYFVERHSHNEIELAAEQISPSSGKPFSPKHVLPWPLPNVWLGVTAEDQATADQRIPLLLSTPATIRFVSIEPMLGPIDLQYPEALFPKGPPMCCDGRECGCRGMPTEPPIVWSLDWVIVGGESGKNARPMHPNWARDLRDQCAASDVPFFHKQNGEWAPGEIVGPNTRSIPCATWFDERWLYETAPPARPDDHIDDEPTVFRCGKSRAGRLLDGVEHNGFPAQRIEA